VLNNIYMKSTIIYKQCLVYLFFTATLFFGFYLNEDLGGGAVYDYNIHKETIHKLFIDGLYFGFLNYDNFSNSHSPLFIMILNFLISNNEIIGRLIYLTISSSIVIVFYKTLALKFKKEFLALFVLSNFFLFSPYFRSYAIWPGDETVALIFFCSSIFFFIKFISSSNKSVIFLILNILSLALASYLRPIYCIFSTYYFFIFLIEGKFNLKIFIFYIVLNLLLAFPAFYYVFILDVNFFSSSIVGFNIINSFTLVYLTIFFYLTPFIFFDLKKIIFKFNLTNFILTILTTIFVILFFNYKMSTGGGFYLKLSEFLFNNHVLVYLLFPISFYYCNQILELQKVKNLILFLLLIFIEIDGFFFMESYDPLFYILFLILFDLDITKNFLVNIKKKICYVFIFQIFLLSTKYYQLYIYN